MGLGGVLGQALVVPSVGVFRRGLGWVGSGPG